MKTCPKCGQSVAEGAAFCGSCGSAIPQTPASDTFCPNCGEKVAGGTGFCPNCGAAISSGTPDAKPPKPPMSLSQRNRVIGIAAAAVAVLLLAIISAFALPNLFSSPAKEFVQFQQELFVDRFLDQAEEMLNTYGSGKFSTDLTISANVNNPEINTYLKDSSVGLKLNLNRDSLIANGELVLMGSPVLSGSLTYDKGQLGFSLPEVDNHYYVMDLSDLLFNVTGLDMDLSQLALPELSGKEWRALAQSYLDVVYTVVTKDNVEVEKKETVRYAQLGGRFEGTVYTFTPTADDVEAMLLKLAENLETDKTLRSLILKVVNPDMLTAAFGEDIFGGYDLEQQLDDAILFLADNLEAQAAYLAEMVEYSNFTWTLALEGKQVRMIRIEADDFALVYESKGNESDGLEEVFYTDSYDYIETYLHHSYTKKGSSYQGEATCTIPYEGSCTVEYSIDESKKSVFGIPYGTYEFDVPNSYLRISLEVGKGQQGGVDHVLSIRGDEYYFDYMFDRIEVIINATDEGSAKKPGGSTVDISDYSYMEFEELFSNLGYVLQEDLIDNLAPLMDGLYGW